MQYKTFMSLTWCLLTCYYLAKALPNRYSKLLILLLAINVNGFCQLIPDFSMPIKLVCPFGEDSVTIGLSTNASEGYNEAYDVIDTSALQLPVDLRIYDPFALSYLGDSCKHFSTSYLDFPTQNTYKIKEFERTFILVARIDLAKVDVSGEGHYCDDPYNGTTFLQVDLNPMGNYQYINDVGYDIRGIEIIPSGNAFIQGIDGTYWYAADSPTSYCITLLPYNSPALPACNIDLAFEIKFTINNSLYVGVNQFQQHNIQIMQTNNTIIVKKPSSFQQIELFDLTGKLLFRQKLTPNHNKQLSIDMNTYSSQIYWFRFSKPENNDYLIHKFFKL